jgi:amidase
LKKHNLDALVSPTNGSSFPASIVGDPIVSVPAGTVRGLPFGCAFIGTAFSEARLLQLAYGYEQATHAIVRPQYRETLDLAPPALP